MPTPVELSLSQLLPAYTVHHLPLELVALTTSLVAQSRAKAASLKPEEEIGRIFACAHIACERLETRFELELANPPPAPVKPTIYKKLHGYLAGVLNAPRTPKAGRLTGIRNGTGSGKTATSRSKKNDSGAQTPSKSALPTPGPVSGKRAREPQNVGESPILDFVKPMIRYVCSNCLKPRAASHVWVGVETVTREIGSRSTQASSSGSSRKRARTSQNAEPKRTVPGDIPTARYPSLIVAIYCLIAAKMDGIELTDKTSFGLIREQAESCAKKFCSTSENKEIKGAVGQMQSNVDFYLVEAEDSGWLNMEWYENVPAEVAEVNIHDEAHDDDEDHLVAQHRPPAKTPLRRAEKHGKLKYNEAEDEEPGAAGLLSGLATMFQPAIDWLSDERRAGYARWKEGMLRQIALVEQQA